MQRVLSNRLFRLAAACAFVVTAACSNDANTGEHNEGITEGQRNNIESVDNPTTPGDNPASHTGINAPQENPDTAQMHRKITGDQVPNDQTKSNDHGHAH